MTTRESHQGTQLRLRDSASATGTDPLSLSPYGLLPLSRFHSLIIGLVGRKTTVDVLHVEEQHSTEEEEIAIALAVAPQQHYSPALGRLRQEGAGQREGPSSHHLELKVKALAGPFDRGASLTAGVLAPAESFVIGTGAS